MSHDYCPHCGCTIEPLKGKPRSPEQHRRFFALVRAVFLHWPEGHETQFSDETEARKWLTMKAKYRDLVMRMPLMGMKPDALVFIVRGALRAAGAHAAVTVHKGELCVFSPRSIAFNKMSHLEFCKLNEDVATVIEQEMGISSVEELLKERA